MKIPRAGFALATATLAMVFSLFMSSYISAFFMDEEYAETLNDNVGMGINERAVGYYVCIWASFYTISAFFVGPLSKKYSP
jgi:hypothetical protein